VPAVIVSFLGAGNWIGLVFFLTWVSGYPVSYFLGRALVARVRRGAWTSKAKTELQYLGSWLAINAIGVITLVVLRPWIIYYGIIVIALWAISVYLSWAGHERGIINDLVLVGLASLAPVLMYQVAKNHSSLRDLPHSIWIAALMSLLYFAGSVVHVKALIREAKNRNWHFASIAFHVVVLGLLLLFARPWPLSIPFAIALVRTVIIKPGLRPGLIGIVEAVVALSLVICTVSAQV